MNEPIIVRQWPDEESRTPTRPCCWIAEAVIDGWTFTARSRYGAPNELARQLVAAGIPDAPMQVHSAGLAGHMTWSSFYRVAGYTHAENAQMPLRRRRHRGREDGPLEGAGEAIMGVKADPATGVAPDALAAE